MNSSVASVASGLLGLATIGGLAAMGAALARRGRPYLATGLAVVPDGRRDPVGSALRYGYAGLEVAVRLAGDRLHLAGAQYAADPGATLDRMVFGPLARLVKPTSHGRVYADRAETFLLLIQVADDGDAAYDALDRLLREHASMLTRCVDGRVTHGAVTVVLTGGRWPRARLAEAYERYAFLECGFADLALPPPGAPSTLAPLVTEALATRLGWDPREEWREFPAEARHILRSLVLTAHSAGRQVRFVDVPDRPRRVRRAFWRELRAAGVDFVASPRLASLARFLRRSAMRSHRHRANPARYAVGGLPGTR